MDNDREAFDAEYGVRTDGQIHLGPINIDDLSTSELEIVGNHPALHEEVKRYARLILVARDLRLAANINDALRLERRAERIYQQEMPKMLRW